MIVNLHSNYYLYHTNILTEFALFQISYMKFATISLRRSLRKRLLIDLRVKS